MSDPKVVSPRLTKDLGFSTATVPSNLYYSPEQFELERERIFAAPGSKWGASSRFRIPAISLSRTSSCSVPRSS